MKIVATSLLIAAAFSQANEAGAADFRSVVIPIPPMPDRAATALSYHAIPVDLHSSLSKEPLVDIVDFGLHGQNYYARRDGWNAPYYGPIAGAQNHIWCRLSVAKKLAQANKILRPLGLELYILDAFRGLDVQRQLWQYFLQQGRKALGAKATAAECTAFAGKYCSDPGRFARRDSRSWPTHLTGGAVDVTLRCIDSGELLFMGGIFDDASQVSHTAYFENLAALDGSSGLSARINRRILYGAMQAVGFVNYPYEWWHYDFGNQMWLQNAHALSRNLTIKNAWYGPAMD